MDLEKKEKDAAELFDELQYAKKAVLSILKNHRVTVNMHGLVYWAEKVETLRKQLLEKI